MPEAVINKEKRPKQPHNRARGVCSLNPHQAAFVREYLLDPTRNAGRAYLRAGYKSKTAYVASVCASQLLNNPKVQAELQRLSAALDKTLEAQKAQVVHRLMQQAFVDIGDVFGPGWRLRPLEQLDPAVRAAISKVQFGAKGEPKVDLAARDKALELLCRHVGLFKPQVAVTGPGGAPLLPLEALRALMWEADAADAADAAALSPPVLPSHAAGARR